MGAGRREARLVVSCVLAGLVWTEGISAASSLTAGARIDGLQLGSGGDSVIWARNSDGDLIAHNDFSVLAGGIWTNYGKPNGVAVGERGVAATSIDANGEIFQEVFYVGADGNLYQGEKSQYTAQGTSIKVCKLNASLNACDGGWQSLSVGPDFDRCGVPIPGTSNHVIRTYTGYSMAASPTTSGVVFLCYEHAESGCSESCPPNADGNLIAQCPQDIGCSRGFFDSSTQEWSWSPVVGVGPQNDGRDQFMPEVSATFPTYTWVSSVSGEGEVYVSWYDRYADPGNRTYRVRTSRSLDAGLSWSSPRPLDSTDSDPENLPRHCKHPNLRFIGDYAGSRASTLHTHALYITVPGTTVDTDVGTSFRSLGSWYN